MMGDMVTYKPRCCKCKVLACGRICYAGNKENIIDNPFCSSHYEEIYIQTRKLVGTFFHNKIEGEWVVIQKWQTWQPTPSMPESMGEIIKNGVKLSDHAPTLQSIS